MRELKGKVKTLWIECINLLKVLNTHNTMAFFSPLFSGHTRIEFKKMRVTLHFSLKLCGFWFFLESCFANKRGSK